MGDVVSDAPEEETCVLKAGRMAVRIVSPRLIRLDKEKPEGAGENRNAELRFARNADQPPGHASLLKHAQTKTPQSVYLDAS
jgi:hypothetical protein